MTDDRTTFLVNMADSSDEDAAAAVFVMLYTSRKRKKRKIWVRPWIMQRYKYLKITKNSVSVRSAI